MAILTNPLTFSSAKKLLPKKTILFQNHHLTTNSLVDKILVMSQSDQSNSGNSVLGELLLVDTSLLKKRIPRYIAES